MASTTTSRRAGLLLSLDAAVCLHGLDPALRERVARRSGRALSELDQVYLRAKARIIARLAATASAMKSRRVRVRR